MKKEKLNYFKEFIKITEYIDESTQILIKLIEGFTPDELYRAGREIHQLENYCDSIVHHIRQYLITDFLPPIDREDIGTLLHKLDNVEDCLDEIVNNFITLNITSIKKRELNQYENLLQEGTKYLKDVFQKLQEINKKDVISEKSVRLNELEEKADTLYEQNMRKLYKEEKNAIEVIKWTEIYKGLEDLFDNYEQVADCIEDIMIKSL